MSINYEATYNQGIEAGQRLYARSPNCLPPQLRKEAETETAMQDLPMVLHAHFKDGVIAGYEAARAVLLETNTRTIPVEEVCREGQHGQS